MIPAGKGTYALILQLSLPCRIKVGRLGLMEFPAGLYIYVGSAFGPGGLRARIAHHMKRASRPHWHIDHLRRVCDVEEVWYVEGERLECTWARRLLRNSAAVPVPGFGCTDCRCNSHLFRVDAAHAERPISCTTGKATV